LTTEVGANPEKPSEAKFRHAEWMVLAGRAIVLWERVWPALWRGLVVIGAYAILALLGILEMLPSPARVVLLGLVGVSLFVLYWKSFGPLRMPQWADGARRLEIDSGLADRALTEGNDHLAAGHNDPLTAKLWRLHMLRLLAGAKNLRLKWPSPKLQRHDRYGVRFAVLAALIAAFFYAGSNAVPRLQTALMPPLADPGEDVLFNAWVSPPPYTALPPQTLAEGTTPGSGTITVATGSKLSLRLRDKGAFPRLVVMPSEELIEFVETEGGFEAEITLTREVHIVAEIGVRPLGDWQFNIIPDESPTIEFAETPKADEHRATVFSYKAADDYGIADAMARIVPEANPEAPPLLVPLAPPANARQAAQSIARDLTAHGYAGAVVQVTLIATDGAGQTGESKPVTFKLPERIFTHPLARAIIEQRKGLAVNGDQGRETAEAAMEALSIGPELFYGDDYGVYLGIRAIRHRLANIRSEEEKEPSMSLMWDMAVALDEGELADALEALRAAQDALADAIRRGASEEEIQELMDRMRQAMARYMQQLAQNAQPGQMGQMPPGGQMMSADDLEALMQAIEDLARTGNAEEAAQLLAGLMAMLENMQMVQGQGGQPGQQGQQGQAGPQQEAIQGLGDLMGQQRQLMDRTFRAQRGQQGQQGQGQQGQQGQPGEGQQGNTPSGPGQPGEGQAQQGQQFGDNGQPGPGGLAQEQQNLNETLRGIMQGLAENGQPAPDGLAGAGQAMSEAEGNLQSDQYGAATEAQQEALNQMRAGAQELARNLNQNGQQGAQANGALNEDPLGRRQGGNNPVGRLMEGLPAQSDLQRAREILDELRRRAAELGRSQEELDYIERLLDFF
jgi:uncharacterized protein (TIGR02302 family)